MVFEASEPTDEPHLPRSVKLTDELVRRLPFTTKGQAKIRDDECKGLLLVIGMEPKTFSAKLERVVNGIREFAYQSFGSFDPRPPTTWA